MVDTTRTHIGQLRDSLKAASDALAVFEDFRSPVNHEVVAAAWAAKGDDQLVKVAVREYTGTFYRGTIVDPGTKGGWVVLADDNELVPNVAATTFVSLTLVPRP